MGCCGYDPVNRPFAAAWPSQHPAGSGFATTSGTQVVPLGPADTFEASGELLGGELEAEDIEVLGDAGGSVDLGMAERPSSDG